MLQKRILATTLLIFSCFSFPFPSLYRMSVIRCARSLLRRCTWLWWSCCCLWSTWLYLHCALKTQWKSDVLMPDSACSRTSVSAESTSNRTPWPMVDRVFGITHGILRNCLNSQDLNILCLLFRKAAVSSTRICGAIHDPPYSSWSRPYQTTGFGAAQRRQRVWVLNMFTHLHCTSLFISDHSELTQT